MIARRAPLLLLTALLAPALSATAHALTDADRDRLIQQSIANYQACGHPCACPYSLDRRGRPCGNRSAYIRPHGKHPLCYRADIPGDQAPAVDPPDRCRKLQRPVG